MRIIDKLTTWWTGVPAGPGPLPPTEPAETPAATPEPEPGPRGARLKPYQRHAGPPEGMLPALDRAAEQLVTRLDELADVLTEIRDLLAR